MKRLKSIKAFTLIELLVVITIIGILAGIALPVYNTVTKNAQQTKALAHAKEIALAMKLFAIDYNGLFPRYVDPDAQNLTEVADANQAYATLIPSYVPSETLFGVSKSAWSMPGPDNKVDQPADRLKGGENHWAYVMGLNDTSNPSWPLIADGFTGNGGAAGANPVYTNVEAERGGVWGGKKAIVIRADTSGAIETLNSSTPTAAFVRRQDDRTKNAFSVDGAYLAGATVLNPKVP